MAAITEVMETILEVMAGTVSGFIRDFLGLIIFLFTHLITLTHRRQSRCQGRRRFILNGTRCKQRHSRRPIIGIIAGILMVIIRMSENVRAAGSRWRLNHPGVKEDNYV